MSRITGPSKGLFWVLLILSVNVYSLFPLKLSVSFHGLSTTANQAGIEALVYSCMDNPDNIPTITALVTYGENGLVEALQKSCWNWSRATLLHLLHLFHISHRSAELQLLFFSPTGVLGIHALRHELGLSEPDLSPLIYFNQPPEHSYTASAFERYEQVEPRGLWWPHQEHLLQWSPIVQKQASYYAGPIFRVGMLELFNSVTDAPILTTIYTGTLGVDENPLKQFWSLLGLIRVHCLYRNHPASQFIESQMGKYFSQYERSKPRKLNVQIIQFWLCTYSKGFCKSAKERNRLFWSIITGPDSVAFAKHSHAFMNAVLLILLYHDGFEQYQLKALIDRFIYFFPQMDDHELSNFLWHANTLTACRADPNCIQSLIGDSTTRGRLLRIAPFRKHKWISLLVSTDMGIVYFRRWLKKYTDRHSHGLLASAHDDTCLLRAVRRLDWRSNIPLPPLNGVSMRQRLGKLIKTLLERPACPFRAHTFGNPHRVWISLVVKPNRTSLLPPLYSDLIGLVLRLRLHDDGDGDQVEYDLCTNVLQFFQKSFWRHRCTYIVDPMELVYPQWPGETCRSRICP